MYKMSQSSLDSLLSDISILESETEKIQANVSAVLDSRGIGVDEELKQAFKQQGGELLCGLKMGYLQEAYYRDHFKHVVCK